MVPHPTYEKRKFAVAWRLENALRWITEPAPSIQEVEQHFQARLLASLLVTFIFLGFLSITVQLITVPDFRRIFPTLFGSLFILIIAYFLSRSRYYQLGAVITVVIPAIAVFVNLSVDPDNSATLFYLIISVLLSSVLLSWRWTAVLVVAIPLVTIFLSFMIPLIDLANLVAPLGFSILASGLVLVIMRYRDLLETSRRAALTLSENRWRLMINQSPFSTVVYAPDGRLQNFNQAALDLWKLSPQDLEIMLREYNVLKDPQLEAKGVLSYIRRSFAGTAATSPPLLYEFSRTDESGLTVSDQRWITTHCYPVKDDGGQLHEVVVVHEDITQRKRAEEALRRSEAYFRSLIENISDIVSILDADGTIHFESPAIERVLGYSPDELIGKNAFDFVHVDDVPDVQKIFAERVRLKGLAPPIELRFQHKDGSWRVLEVFGNNLLNEPDVAGVVINSRDITERKQAEEMIRRQDRLAAVGQLAAGIAHDFNNIMAVIILYADLLLKSSDLGSKAQRQLETVRHQAVRAADLTGQVLDFSRQSVMEQKPVDLVPFFRELTRLVERTFPEHINVAVECKLELCMVNADITRMQQVIMNLALNARDAMPNGGELRLEIAEFSIRSGELPPLADLTAGKWVRIAVSDNGAGMSPEVLSHLFEPFFTTKPPGQGTGLGLAQVYGIVKQHDGYIDVKSQSGQGTTFMIYLPALTEVQSAAKLPVPDVVILGRGETILVVEDDPATRTALAESLDLLNYHALTAANGREALAILDENQDQVALILSDVVMPEMGGMVLLQALKERGIGLPVVMLTGHPLGEALEALRAEGLREWLPKPPTLEKLAQVMAHLLHEEQDG